jgi:hypothetical protein
MFFDRKEIQSVMTALDEEKSNISNNLYLLLARILKMAFDQNKSFDKLRSQVRCLLDVHLSKQQFEDTEDLIEFLQETIEIIVFISQKPHVETVENITVNDLTPILQYYLSQNSNHNS